jgi:hypothetical protein
MEARVGGSKRLVFNAETRRRRGAKRKDQLALLRIWGGDIIAYG